MTTAAADKIIRGMRSLAVAMEIEGAYQQAVSVGFRQGREMFVAMGLHQASRNVRLYQVMWKAMGELNAYRAALAA